MTITRVEAVEKIESQRRAIREHIEKYYKYPHEYDKNYALKTILRCQQNIQELKERCPYDIDDSYEDYWTPEQ